MAECWEHKYLDDFIVDFIDEPMLFGDSSGIDRTIVALKLFHLTSTRPGVFPDFVKKFW